ncbi:MAG: hypothetical protein ACOC4G_09545 [Bacillota bacterium]
MKVKVEMNIDFDMTEEEIKELNVIEIRDMVAELLEEAGKSYYLDIDVKRVEQISKFSPLS